jgi:hypothetical protein
MSKTMRDSIIKAGIAHYEAKIQFHQVNLENLLHNSVGVAEHPDLMETVEKELTQMAHYRDLLDELKRFD